MGLKPRLIYPHVCSSLKIQCICRVQAQIAQISHSNNAKYTSHLFYFSIWEYLGEGDFVHIDCYWYFMLYIWHIANTFYFEQTHTTVGISNPKYHCYMNSVILLFFSILRTISHNFQFNSSVEGSLSKCLFQTDIVHPILQMWMPPNLDWYNMMIHSTVAKFSRTVRRATWC